MLALTSPAGAEDWEQKGTVPLVVGNEQVAAVNDSGVVVIIGFNKVFRWTQTGGKQQIAGDPGTRCSYSIAGISNEGAILGTRSCSNESASQTLSTLLAWTPDSGNNPIEPIGGDLQAEAIAPNGKFIATDHHGTTYDRTDDTVVTGDANVAPQTGALLFGSTAAGGGQGIDRTVDGTSLIRKFTSTDYNVPPTFYRDDHLSGPNFVRSSETFERVFGLLPDERVLALVAGNCGCADPATDYPSMKLMAYDKTNGSKVPLNAGGMKIFQNQNFLPGGGGKSIYATGSGGGVPEGDGAIVAWSLPSELPHALPMFFPVDAQGRSTVTPVASSDNGAWLVLSNGEYWYDKQWELGFQPEKLAIADQVKRYAFDQQQYYEGQIQHWQHMQKRAFVALGPFASINPVMLANLTFGEIGQGVEFTVAIQNRDYWATVSLDPLDPKWRTVASAPAVHISKLRRPRDLSNMKFRQVKEFLGARLAFLANQICQEDAINRGATAFDKDSLAKMQAQYAAGAKCSIRAAAAARRAKALAPEAAATIDKSLLKINSLKDRAKTTTKSQVKEAVNWQWGQIERLIDLPPSFKEDFKELFERLDKPITKKKVVSIRPNIVAGASHDGGTAAKIGQVGDAFEKHADQNAD